MAEEKKSKMSLGWIIAIVVILVILWGVGTYNNLVGMSGAIDGNWAQVENNLQRRYDLIPNLVNTVKGYAAHEEGVYTEIADARTKLAGAKTVEEVQNASNELESGLGRLLAIAEAYPELKANENFMSLQDELAGTENRLATSRKDYNDSVKIYNVKIKTIPTNFIAGLLGMNAREYFEISEGAQNNVTVDFSE